MLWPFALVIGLAVGLSRHAAGFTPQAERGALAAMCGSVVLMIISVLIAARRRRMDWGMAVLLPVYWLLHAFAGWRGLLQLIRDPYTWEKTVHGGHDRRGP
jgi:hypothetical protein